MVIELEECNITLCINGLPIIVNLSVILGSQYFLNFYYPTNVKLGKKERINLIVVCCSEIIHVI